MSLLIYSLRRTPLSLKRMRLRYVLRDHYSRDLESGVRGKKFKGGRQAFFRVIISFGPHI